MRILHVVHGFAEDAPAGAELHVAALAARQASPEGGGRDVSIFARVRRADAADLSLVDVANDGAVRRFGFNHLGRIGNSFTERDRFPPAERAFETVMAKVKPDVVHVHHLAGLSIGVFDVAKRGGAFVAATVHDHALACPRGRRVRLDLAYCATLDRARCARCVRPAWIEAARRPSWSSVFGALIPGASRRLFEKRDAAVRSALDRVDRFIAPSRSAAELFEEFYPAGGRLVVVPHGSPPPSSVAPPIRSEGAPLRVGFFGAPHPTKGARTAAEAVGRVTNGRARLYVHGATDAAEATRLAAAARGRAEFPGAYAPSELSARMASIDVVVLPSLFAETFSLTLREAWAHRRPAVASRVGAFVEAVGDGDRRGILFEPGDAAGCAAAFHRLLDEPGLFDRLCGPFSDEPRSAAFDAVSAAYGPSDVWSDRPGRG